jgi:hypothetical protein
MARRSLSPLALSCALVLAAIYLLQMLLAVRQQSQTFDEGYHLAAGYRYWQCGDFGINPEHPPLVKFIAAAPVWLAHIKAPSGECGKESTNKEQGYDRSFAWYYSEGNDAERMTRLGRAAVTVFSGVVAVVCFLFANELFGATAALLALTLLVFEPTLLAHGPLITTDTAVTAMMAATVYAFYRYVERQSAARLVLVGVVAGITLGVKHSGVLVLPVLLLLTLYEAWRTRRKDRQQTAARHWMRYLVSLAAIVVIAAGVLWSTYGFRYAARPHEVEMTEPLFQFITDVEEQGTRTPIVTRVIPIIARFHLLPEAYLYGFVDVLNISDPGQPPFLLGKLYPHGQWFYFPITFAIKSSLGFLALLTLAFFVPWRKLGMTRQLVYLATPVAVVLYFGMRSGLNIGYRHVLPIVPFLCILLGTTAAYLLRRGRAWQVAVVVLFAWYMVSSLRAYPNYIPYSNEAFGGPSRTYRVLTDANADWGQGMKQVGAYLKQNGKTDCWIAYDGVASRHYYGAHCRELPPNRWANIAVVPQRIEGTLLISSLTASGIEWENEELNPYREFLKRRPDDVIDGSILVFRGTFDLPGVAAVQHIANANHLNDQKKFAAARDEAQQGVALMPQSVRGHLALGDALAGLNANAQAKQAYETALRLAAAQPQWYPNEIGIAQRELKKIVIGNQ